MKSTDGIPRGKRMKLSDHPDFVPHRSTVSHGYSLRPEQIAFVKANGGSKFVRSLIDKEMEAETQDNQKSQKLIDEVMQ